MTLDSATLDDAQARRLVRTGLIPALRTAGDDVGQAHALGLWLAVEPGKVSDRLQLSATLIRLGREEEAQALLAGLGQDHADDPAVAVAAIQLALRQGRIAEAAAIAEGFGQWREVPARAA